MLPLAPNTVTVTRPAGQSGDYDDSALSDEFGDPLRDENDALIMQAEYEATVVASAARCAITTPTGADLVVGGHKEVVDAVLTFPATPALAHTDLVTDDDTADAYRIVWVRRRRGLGLDHQVAGLRAVTGAASG